MRRLRLAATCCWLVAVAVTSAHAEDQAPAAQSAWASSWESSWDWLRARMFGTPAPAETAAQALARRGGARLLLEADTDPLRAAILEDLRADVRRLLREARIAYRDLAIRDGAVDVRVRDVNDLPGALAALARAAVAPRDVGDGLIRLAPSQRALDGRLDAWFDRNIDVIQRRLDAVGLTGAGAQREGIGGIAVLLPGVTDPAPIADMLARRGELELRLVDLSIDANDAAKAGAPAGAELLYDKDKRPYVVSKQAPLGGRDIVDAQPSFSSSQHEEPVVDFRFTEQAAQVFAHVTEDNVGRPFAIVLDGIVISAPVIREPIRAGRGQISGNFTVQQANDLAILLRSGALAFGMTVVEARIVTPAGK